MWWTAAVTDATPAADPEAPRPPSFTVRPRRGRKVLQTVRDMVFSLGAIGAAVAVILVITHRPLPDPVRVVDLNDSHAFLYSKTMVDVALATGRWRRDLPFDFTRIFSGPELGHKYASGRRMWAAFRALA